MSSQPPYDQPKRSEEHVPHALCKEIVDASRIKCSSLVDQSIDKNGSTKGVIPAQQSIYNNQVLLNLQKLGLHSGLAGLPHMLSPAIPPPTLPNYIKALPARLGQDDLKYLQNKGALAIPDSSLRNELLKNYVEFVHPYMPLLDIHEFLQAVDRNDGSATISLLLFQSVMFAGIATIEVSFLRAAGYSSRREARRD